MCIHQPKRISTAVIAFMMLQRRITDMIIQLVLCQYRKAIFRVLLDDLIFFLTEP